MSHAPLDGLDRVLDVAPRRSIVDRDLASSGGGRSRTGCSAYGPAVGRQLRGGPPSSSNDPRAGSVRIVGHDLSDASPPSALATPSEDSRPCAAWRRGSGWALVQRARIAAAASPPVSQIARREDRRAKSFVTSAGHAKTYVVSTIPRGGPWHQACTWWATASASTSVRRGKVWACAATRARPVTFDRRRFAGC